MVSDLIRLHQMENVLDLVGEMLQMSLEADEKTSIVGEAIVTTGNRQWRKRRGQRIQSGTFQTAAYPDHGITRHVSGDIQ